jgi:hypothetical protein
LNKETKRYRLDRRHAIAMYREGEIARKEVRKPNTENHIRHV